MRPALSDETVLIMLVWAIDAADHPGQIVIETWPEPHIPLAVTVLNQPVTDPKPRLTALMRGTGPREVGA